MYKTCAQTSLLITDPITPSLPRSDNCTNYMFVSKHSAHAYVHAGMPKKGRETSIEYKDAIKSIGEDIILKSTVVNIETESTKQLRSKHLVL